MKQKKFKGTPYSLREARLVAAQVDDQYARSIILWLCDEVEELRAPSKSERPFGIPKKDWKEHLAECAKAEAKP